MTLPAATLDHVVINARDDMDRAADIYRRLGFTLTPRGYHTLGSINHLAMFGTDYLELIGAPPGATDRADILGWPEGLNALVWGTEDAAALHATLAAASIPAQPPGHFSRPAAPDAAGRAESLAALALRSTKLDAAAIRVAGATGNTARLLVPAAQTRGVALEFVPACPVPAPPCAWMKRLIAGATSRRKRL